MCVLSDLGQLQAQRKNTELLNNFRDLSRLHFQSMPSSKSFIEKAYDIFGSGADRVSSMESKSMNHAVRFYRPLKHLEGVFRPRFRAGLAQTEGLTGQIKIRLAQSRWSGPLKHLKGRLRLVIFPRPQHVSVDDRKRPNIQFLGIKRNM